MAPLCGQSNEGPTKPKLFQQAELGGRGGGGSNQERHEGLQNGTTLTAAGSVGAGAEAVASFSQEKRHM